MKKVNLWWVLATGESFAGSYRDPKVLEMPGGYGVSWSHVRDGYLRGVGVLQVQQLLKFSFSFCHLFCCRCSL